MVHDISGRKGYHLLCHVTNHKYFVKQQLKRKIKPLNNRKAFCQAYFKNLELFFLWKQTVLNSRT